MQTRHVLAAALALNAACTPPRSVAPLPESVDLVVAATTDIHGRLRGWNYESNRPDPSRGLARAATIVDSLRGAAPGRVVLVDAGDLLQGNSLTYVAARVAPAGSAHPAIAAMNAMGYDAAAVGNHEFNYGLAFLDSTLTQARFPFLAANAVRPNGDRPFPGWTLVERAGVRIGLVGATTPGSMVWDRDNLRGRLVIRDIVPAVRTAVAEARSAGAAVVVVTMHSGLSGASSYDTVATGVGSENVAARLAREVPGVDLIVYGHSHQEMPDTVINGVLLMQPRNWATSVGVAHLRVARTGGPWRVTAKSSRVVQAAGHAEALSVLAATDSAHRATLAWVTAPIGRTPVVWRADSARVADTPLIDFILEVERRAAGTDLASTAAFSLDATLDSGVVTAARLQALYPYDNTLRAVRISGAQLRAYLEHSARYYRTSPDGTVSVDPTVPGFNFDIVAGADYTLDVSRPVGERVTELRVSGKPVAPSDSFTMALNNYRQAGGGGYAMLAGAPVVYDRQQEIRQLLVDEVRRRGTLTPDSYFTPNWRLEPARAVAALYAQLRAENREDAHATGIVGAAVEKAAPAAAPSPSAATIAPPPAGTRLRLIGTNDFHGALEPRPDATGRARGGAAHLATAIRRARQACVRPACESILVDGGDEFQGTPASNLAFGRPVVAMFHSLGLTASALGNHEFDWGQDTLRARMREAHYGILGANVRYASGRDVPWIRDDTLVTVGELKVGVIGVSTVTTPSTTKAAHVTDLRFVEPAPVVDSLARRLRARGARYVIVIAHAGAFCSDAPAGGCAGEIVELARAVREPIDAIVSGHTHSLVNTTVNGIPILQARASGAAVEVVDLGAGGGHQAVYEVFADELPADPAVATIVREAAARVAPIVNRPIATIAQDLRRTGPQYPLGNLLADALRVQGRGDVAVTNNGGIRADLRAGPATYGALFEVQPFGNQLYRLTVTGAMLRQYLEKLVSRAPTAHVSGVRVHYDSTRAPGARLLDVRLLDGRPLEDEATYRLVMNDFLVTGGDGLALGSTAGRVERLPLTDLDAVIAYLRSRPQPVRAPAEDRLSAVGSAR